MLKVLGVFLRFFLCNVFYAYSLARFESEPIAGSESMLVNLRKEI